jgi:hypothetical protein
VDPSCARVVGSTTRTRSSASGSRARSAASASGTFPVGENAMFGLAPRPVSRMANEVTRTSPPSPPITTRAPMAANHRLSFSVKRFRDIDARPNTGDRPDSNRSVDHNSTHGVADRAYRNTDEILVTADHDRRRARYRSHLRDAPSVPRDDCGRRPRADPCDRAQQPTTHLQQALVLRGTRRVGLKPSCRPCWRTPRRVSRRTGQLPPWARKVTTPIDLVSYAGTATSIAPTPPSSSSPAFTLSKVEIGTSSGSPLSMSQSRSNLHLAVIHA